MKKLLLLISLIGLLSNAFAQDDNAVIPPTNKYSLHAQDVTVMLYSPDGKTIVTGSRDLTIKTWDATTLAEGKTFSGHEATVNCIAISKDSKYMLSGSDDGTVLLWDFEQGKIIQRIRNHTGPVYGVAFSVDAQTKYYYSTGEDGSIQVYDRTINNKNIKAMKTEGNGNKAMLMDPRGKFIYTAGYDGKIRQYDPETNALLNTYAAGHTGEITAMIFSPDYTKIATAADDKKIIIWDTATHNVEKTLLGHTWKIFSISYNNNGEYMASSSNDGSVRIWNVSTAKEVKQFATPKRRTFFTVMMKADATSVFAAIQTKKPGDPTVYTWDTGVPATTAVVPVIVIEEPKKVEPIKTIKKPTGKKQ
ncbi:MAG: WD40 repeat domain-containing protein [Bacteroidetes bacterium]|nr:WD40 repeat domain-containing protein [Bacteroidota bacterium]